VSALWTSRDLARAASGEVVGDPPAEITGISIDSRTVGPGEAFVAIRGDRFDGHEYAAAALRAGAGLAVVTRGKVPPDSGPLIAVADDPLAALERIGAAARARMAGPVIAVTGSVGKTSTKEMLRTAFSAIGRTHAPVGSFNNHWGVPLTLARMPADSAFAVFEIGMNHAGEIRPLVGLVRPHVAIVTTVEPVHLEHFPDESGIAEAKGEIFEGLETGGTAVLNRDNRWFDLLRERASARGARILTFGESAAADVRLERVSLHGDGSSVQAAIAGESVAYRLGAPGRHLVQNSLAVLATAHAIGADLSSVMLALAQFRAPKGRGEQIQLAHPAGPITLIDESYNANPASMRAGLALLAQTAPKGRGRRIAVLGDMLELGEEAEAMHRGILQPIEESDADLVFLAGPMMESLWRDLPDQRRGAYCQAAAGLEQILVEAIGPGDVVMIKASAGTKLGLVVEGLKRRFSAAAQ
jgi:UDP-N-acetylmuramoyl-tripeptide--D-alanyl-D-alanine ligase